MSFTPTKKASEKELKIFGLIFGTLFPLWLYLKWARGINAYGFLAICIFISFISAALIKPLLLKPVHFALSTVFKYIQNILTYFVLLFIFYLVVTPLGILLRGFGKDILDIKIDKKVASYWKPTNLNNMDKEQYRRHY